MVKHRYNKPPAKNNPFRLFSINSVETYFRRRKEELKRLVPAPWIIPDHKTIHDEEND